LECYIYGISRKNTVGSVAVYVKGSSVRLSGPDNYQHHVHPSNVDSLEGWKKEIILVWHLTDLVIVPEALLNSETHKVTIERLEKEAAKRGGM